MSNNLIHVPIGSLVEAPRNYRTEYHKEDLTELADSIRRDGIISPPTVREFPAGSGTYLIVAGSRRFKASQLAGLTEIPVVIRDLTDRQVLEIQLIENLQRQDPHPLDEAGAFQEAIQLLNYSIEELALRVSKSPKYITERLKLNELIGPFKEIFYRNEIMLAHATLVCRLAVNDQQRCFAKIHFKGHDDKVKYVISPGELKKFIDTNITMLLDKSPFSKKDESLLPEAGPCTTCPKRSGFNTDLFHDVAEKDRCHDSNCFNTKLQAHISNKVKELEEVKEDFKLISESWWMSDSEKKLNPKVLTGQEYKEVSKKDKCESAIKGVITHGGDLGKVINICIDKKCPVHYRGYSNDGSTSVSPKKLHEEKKKRNLELDEEKVHKKIVDALGALPVMRDKKKLLTKSETVGMLYLIYQQGGWDNEDLLKELGWMKGGNIHECDEIFFKKIKTSTQEERAFLIRNAVFKKFKSITSSRYTEGMVLREIALEWKVPVAEFEAEQDRIRKAREEKAEQRLKDQLTEEKKAKTDTSPGKLGRGLAALLDDKPAKKSKKGVSA